MKNVLILLIILTLVVTAGILISEASGAGISRTQSMSVTSETNYKPESCIPPNCVPGPIPSPDPVPGPKPDPYAPSPWVTAANNSNYEARIEYINGEWYGELRDKSTGQIVLYVPLPDGNNTHMFDVSPDGSTVFYDLGNTIYAQRVSGSTSNSADHPTISTAGRYTSISFNGDWAKLEGTVNGAPGILWLNIKTAEVRTTDPRGPLPL